MKTNKQWYLVIRTQNFFDGHGSPDEGEVTKYLTQNPEFLKLDEDKYYTDEPFEGIEDEDLKNLVCDEDYLHAEDGYNCTAYSFIVKKVKAENVEKIQKIISDYEKL